MLAHGVQPEYAAIPPEHGGVPEDPEEEVSKTWQYVWRGVLTVFSILVIVVFVKAWIDADDVDVRIS